MEEIFKVYKKTQKSVWEVSNYGRVKRNGEIYICRPNISGYLIFGGSYYLHKIVAILFIPNPNNYNEVDHIDGNKLNNFYLNLRWCTHKENQNNPITLKRMSESQKIAQKGEKNGMYGKQHTQETKTKMSKSLKGKFAGEQNPMYGVHRFGEKNPMYGKDHSGDKNPMYGRKHSQEFKNKMSEWHKNHKKVLCEDEKYHYKLIE